MFQAAVAGSFLADLGELSGNEDYPVSSFPFPQRNLALQ
jgi:hypothetical protein